MNFNKKNVEVMLDDECSDIMWNKLLESTDAARPAPGPLAPNKIPKVEKIEIRPMSFIIYGRHER